MISASGQLMCEMNSERQRKNKEAAEGAENHLARNEGRNVFVITGLGLILKKTLRGVCIIAL